MFLPGALEFDPIAVRIKTGEELLVSADARLDKVFRRLLEDRAALLGIGLQQRVVAPALELGGELPTEIDRVVEPVVEAVGAIGRMRMGGIAGNEDAADLVILGDRDAQVPKADIVEVAGKRKAS